MSNDAMRQIDIQPTREAAGMSRAELAKEVNVSESTVYRWEMAKRRCHSAMLRTVSECLAKKTKMG